MSTRASIGGHPIHPILVTIPIGLWVFSLVCDLVFISALGDSLWNDMAFYTMAGGVVGALLAAVPGLIDLLTMTVPREKKVGIAHMCINLVVVGLYAANLWLRSDSQPGALVPIVMSGVTIILLMVAGWLGGEMVFKYGMGVHKQPVEEPAARKDHPRAA